MGRGPGRAANIERDVLNDILKKYKDRIYDETTQKTVPRSNSIQNKISEKVTKKIGVEKSAVALYTHVSCGRAFPKPTRSIDLIDDEVRKDIFVFLMWYFLLNKNDFQNEHNDSRNDGQADTSATSVKGTVIELKFNNDEFNKFVGETTYANNEKKKKSNTREYPILTSGWQNAIVTRLRDDHDIGCASCFNVAELMA